MNIKQFCLHCNLGTVINIKKLTGGLMHKMFKVETTTGTYAIKVLNPEVMSRSEAYDNFYLSESIANLAEKNGIPVLCAKTIANNFITKYEDFYYMVFDFIEGKTLTDDEITIEHCGKIGEVLAKIHSLDYSSLGLTPNIVKYQRLYDWESYINHPNFAFMPYKDLFIKYYQRFNSQLKRANERFNESNTIQTVCHRDMDPKNVMWNNGDPIIIDWESASLANPYRELVEYALSWSGFLSDNFNKEKFIAVVKAYSKYIDITNVEWFNVICGNLVGRFGWLKYNLERSLGIISNDPEEIEIAQKEVTKTINEINRYLSLIDTIDSIFIKLTTTVVNKDEAIKKIIASNPILNGYEYELINSGFTNTIYRVGPYIIRICTNPNNEERFKTEINFYTSNKDNPNIPKMYIGDTSKSIIPYYYEIIERIEGNTLYEVWPTLPEKERKQIVISIISILKTIHKKVESKLDFTSFIKDKLLTLLSDCNINDELFSSLLILCDKYFKDSTTYQIHGDLHFDNFIYKDGCLTILDFERISYLPLDYDFRIFNRYASTPWLWASAKMDMLTVESDYQDLMPMIIENYPELSSIPYLRERLTIYEIIDLLTTYKNTKDSEVLEQAKAKARVLVK